MVSERRAYSMEMLPAGAHFATSAEDQTGGLRRRWIGMILTTYYIRFIREFRVTLNR